MLPDRRDTANAGHNEIVEAIHKRRPRAAREAMEKHLHLAEQDILDFVERNDSDKRQPVRSTAASRT